MVGAVLWDGKAGQTRDRTEAAKHFRIAAEAGNSAAQRMLAMAYRLGDGGSADFGQMSVWNRKAAEQGDGLAGIDSGQHHRNRRQNVLPDRGSGPTRRRWRPLGIR
jgi:TPR repeat protein